MPKHYGTPLRPRASTPTHSPIKSQEQHFIRTPQKVRSKFGFGRPGKSLWWLTFDCEYINNYFKAINIGAEIDVNSALNIKVNRMKHFGNFKTPKLTEN